jgi:hypothetical protein
MTIHKRWMLLPVILAAACAMGMGDMSLTGEDKAPKWPKRNFTATVTDRTLTTMQIEHANCEGKTEIKGFLGDIRVELSFDKIKKVSLTGAEGGFSDGVVTFRDGQTKSMRFKSVTRCYGESSMGRMMITIKDLKEIELGEPPPVDASPEK